MAALGLWGAAESSQLVWPDKGSQSSHCVRQGRRLQRGGESSGMLPAEGSRQQRKQEKYIFLSLPAPVKRPVRLLIQRRRLSCFLLSLSRSHLSLCPNPPRFWPRTHSLIPNLSFPLNSPFSIVLPVPLCYPPPPSPPVCLSHLNMPPLSINPLTHPGWLQHTLFSLLYLSKLFCFSLLHPLFAPHPLPPHCLLRP